MFIGLFKYKYFRIYATRLSVNNLSSIKLSSGARKLAINKTDYLFVSKGDYDNATCLGK